MNDAAPSESDLVALGAHLHVQLRRKTGRVIDVDWLIANAEYANVIVALAKANAVTQGAPELAIWATRFEQALQRVKRPRQPLLAALAIANATQLERQVLPAKGAENIRANHDESGVISEFGDSHRVIDTSEMPSPKTQGERYVWSLR